MAAALFATPQVWWDAWESGALLPNDPAPADPTREWTSPITVDGLSIDWGRSSLLENPPPATAQVRLLVRGRHADLLGRAVGTRMQLGFTATGYQPWCNFRGRVTSVELEYLDRDNYNRTRYIATLDLSSTVSELKLQNGPDTIGTLDPKTNPVISATQLGIYIEQASRSVIAAGIARPPWNGAVPRLDYSDTTALDLLEQYYATCGHVPNYEPMSNQMLSVYAHLPPVQMGGHLRLAQAADRSVHISPRSISGEYGSGYIRADDCELTSARLDASTSQKYLEMGYYMGRQAALLPPLKGSRTTATGVATSAETTYKVDVLGITTNAPWEQEIVSNSESLLQQRARDAARFTHPPLRMVHRNGWRTMVDLMDALQGKEATQPLYIGGSVFNYLATYPMWRTIGGSIEYSNGVWTTTRTLAPVPPPPTRSSITNETLDKYNVISWEQFDDSLTLDDLDSLEIGFP